MSSIEKSKEILKSGNEDSQLLREFKTLKPQHSSNREAIESALRELEKIAEKHGQSIDELLTEAHSSYELKVHHTQALTLERIIGHLKK